MNKISEHSKKLKIKTSAKWQEKKHNEGAYSMKAFITDKEVAKFAKENIPNKSQFILEAVKRFMA